MVGYMKLVITIVKIFDTICLSVLAKQIKDTFGLLCT